MVAWGSNSVSPTCLDPLADVDSSGDSNGKELERDAKPMCSL